MKELGLVDGKIVDLNENVIRMEDRGHVFGDGVYESTEVYKGKLFALKLHMDRLMYSLRELRIPPPYTYEELAGFHQLLIKETGINRGNIYLQITRGWAPRKHEFPDGIKPRLCMFFRPPTLPPETLWTEGASVILLPDERWLRCDIKSFRDGKITECTHSSFHVIKDGGIWSHPLNHLVLRGITWTILFNTIVGPLGIKVNEKPYDVPFLMKADEAFITSSSKNVVPCVKVDGKPIGNGKPGPISKKLLAAMVEYREKECA
ncbi:MAG: aminotransferase class IV [Deltaproteobacteria bacterium]|nr:aminotransferase class IV [Deltaproteobacteria bacterium]